MPEHFESHYFFPNEILQLNEFEFFYFCRFDYKVELVPFFFDSLTFQ
jgi:hypothetical protein